MGEQSKKKPSAGDHLLRTSVLAEILLYTMAFKYPNHVRTAADAVIEMYVQTAETVPSIGDKELRAAFDNNLQAIREHVNDVLNRVIIAQAQGSPGESRGPRA